MKPKPASGQIWRNITVGAGVAEQGLFVLVEIEGKLHWTNGKSTYESSKELNENYEYIGELNDVFRKVKL
jgi:hypothetical protein